MTNSSYLHINRESCERCHQRCRSQSQCTHFLDETIKADTDCSLIIIIIFKYDFSTRKLISNLCTDDDSECSAGDFSHASHHVQYSRYRRSRRIIPPK